MDFFPPTIANYGHDNAVEASTLIVHSLQRRVQVNSSFRRCVSHSQPALVLAHEVSNRLNFLLIEHATLSDDLAHKFVWRMIKVEIAYCDSGYRRCKHFFWFFFLQELHILSPILAPFVRPTVRGNFQCFAQHIHWYLLSPGCPGK